MANAERGGRRRVGSDRVLLEGLLAGLTLRVAAARAGMSERTARRRTQEEEFQRLQAELTEELAALTATMLSAMGSEALRTIRELMSHADTDGTRLRAAVAALTLALQFRKGEDLQRRLARLELAARTEEQLRARVEDGPNGQERGRHQP